jgi:hypothetical protein
MRTIIGTLAVLTVAGGTLGGPIGTTVPQRVDAAAVIQSEHALYDAIAKGNQEAFQALTLPEGVWTTPSGFVPLGPLAAGLSAFELPKWEIENPHVVWTDGTSALLLYVRAGGGSYASRPFASTMLASTLWTKRGGKWVAVHHQETEMVQ